MGRPRLSSVAVLLFLTFTALAASICDVDSYGKPEASECHTLFDKITNGATSQARFFDEEQLRADSNFSWPGLSNLFGVPIVQVPKYYSMNTCNFALMPYTNPRSRMVQPMAISSWASVKTCGNQLMEGCLDKQGDGGEVFITSQTSEDPTLVMFMWASGAVFEEKLNKYENDPTFSPQLSLSVAIRNNGTAGLASSGVIENNGTLDIPTTVSALPSSTGRAEYAGSIDTS